jgi:phage protein D
MINQPFTSSEARAPRGIVKVNGLAVNGWVSWEVQNNIYYQADTFTVSFVASSLPSDYSVDWFSSQTQISIEILAGFPADAIAFSENDLMSLIYGFVDSVTYNPINGVLELLGRDLTGLLIDEKTTEKYQNLTASQIAQKIAVAHGLTPVITKTKTKSGTFYEIDHARLSDTNSDWDLLTYLANEEGYRVYVKGKSLYFEPKTDPTEESYLLKWTAQSQDNAYPVFNGVTVDFSRSLTVSKGTIVVVRSWNAKQAKAFNVTYPTTKARGTAAGQAKPKAQVYSFTIPNLSPEQALKRARSLYHDIVMHEIKMQATLPADNVLMPTDIIKFEGSNTSFDQLYYPESVTRSMSMDAGYQMAVIAKNHSAENDPLV